MIHRHCVQGAHMLINVRDINGSTAHCPPYQSFEVGPPSSACLG
jgi:hypothetical protein